MPVRDGELTRREGLVALAARKAFDAEIRRSIAEADQLAVTVVAACSLFVDTASAAFSVARGELVNVLNERLAELGLQLVEVRRN